MSSVDPNTEMITFYIRCDIKARVKQLVSYLPVGNVSAYLRQLVLADLKERGHLDINYKLVPPPSTSREHSATIRDDSQDVQVRSSPPTAEPPG